VIETSVSASLSVCVAGQARVVRSLIRSEGGVVDFVQSSLLQSPVEYMTYISAIGRRILIVGHRVLDRRESEVSFCRLEGTYPNHGQEGTNRTESNLSRWNTVGVITSNVGRTTSCPFYCWDVEPMAVEMRRASAHFSSPILSGDVVTSTDH
jgi:hypothetical protein